MDAVGRYFDGRLMDWANVEELADWDGLLLGNGMSINVWAGFDYSSLFEEADLGRKDSRSFKALETTNFEVVLESVDRAIKLVQASGYNADFLKERRTSIADALGRAVNSVHIPRGQIPDENLRSIRSAMRMHRWVFSTSYDLLAYYAAACEEFRGFVDYFWNEHGSFDESTITLNDASTRTRLLFLHGAVHLVVLGDGRTCKRKSSMFSLLEKFDMPHAGDQLARPLLVTEGQSTQKTREIANNVYLAFALRKLREYGDPLVVFGHRLGEQDQHLVDAINEHPSRPLAIGLVDRGKRTNRRRQHEIRSRLEDCEAYFYDAATHPLGSENLKVAYPRIRRLSKPLRRRSLERAQPVG
ncbi:MAG: DUF4917 family protein [Solirubrobacterales bacterium]